MNDQEVMDFLKTFGKVPANRLTTELIVSAMQECFTYANNAKTVIADIARDRYQELSKELLLRIA